MVLCFGSVIKTALITFFIFLFFFYETIADQCLYSIKAGGAQETGNEQL